jgi:hypothetical protein
MKTHILFTLPLLLACKPHFTLDPVYDCTALTKTQQEDMDALLNNSECESWECYQRVMQLYCYEAPSQISR